MALSDTSFEAMDELIRGFHNYLDWNYTIEQWAPYISSIIKIAEAAYIFDRGKTLTDERANAEPWPMSPRLCAETLVVELLVASPGTTTPSQQAMELIVKVAAVNTDLQTAICNSYAWRKSPQGIAQLLSREDSVPVEPLFHMIKQTE